MTRLTRIVRHMAVVSLASGVWWIPTDASAQAGDDAFKLGMQARDQSLRQPSTAKWGDVATQMRRAIEMDGTDSSRKVRLSNGLLGFNRSEMEYLPHFFLGEALFRGNADECPAAMDQWAIAQQQKAVDARREFVTIIEDGYRQCRDKGFLPPAELASVRQSTQQAIDQAEEILKKVAALAQANSSLVLPESLDSARKEISTARGRLTGRTRNDFAEAKSGADRAAGSLRTIEATINTGLRNRSLFESQVAEAEKAIGGARDVDRAIDATNFPLTPELRSTRQASRDQLDSAAGRLENGKRTQSQPLVLEARNVANEAARGLTHVRGEVTRLLREADEKASAEKIQKTLEQAIGTARQAVSFAEASLARLLDRLQRKQESPTTDLLKQRDEFQKRVTDLRPRLDRGNEAKDILGIQTVTRSANSVRARLDELTASFGPVTIEEQVGTALYAAVQSFIDGDFAKTIATLDASSAPADGPLQAHVHVFRAASLYQLYVRSGEKDQALLTRANGEIEQGRKLDPALEPDKRYFSPRFISGYQSGAIRPAAAVTAPAR